MTTDEKRWKVCEFTTIGWKPYDHTCINLTKEQAKEKVEELLREGVAINRLKAFPNDTQFLSLMTTADASYTPKTNDYVKYDHLEGWIYWIDEKNTYLTLEIMTRKKSEQSYRDCNLHRNERCLVCVYPEDWDRLEYVKSR